jgi:hypothetical protein
MIKRRAVFAMWLVLGAGLPPALVADTPAHGERYNREGPPNPRALFRFGWLLAFVGEVERAA